MPLTPAQRQARARTKRDAKLARYEAALQLIAEAWHETLNPNGWRVASDVYNPAKWAHAALCPNGESYD